jgi:hypothetical protein
MSSLIGSDSFWAGAEKVRDCVLCMSNHYTIFQWCLDNRPEIAKMMKSCGLSMFYDNKNAELTFFIPSCQKFLNYESLLFHTVRRRIPPDDFNGGAFMIQTALAGHNMHCLDRVILSGAGRVPCNDPIKVANGYIYILL